MNEPEKITIEEAIVGLDQRTINLEHQNEIIIKLLRETQSHLWTKSEKEPTPISLDNIIHQENQAINYVNNVVMPKLQKKEIEAKEGLIQAESWGSFLMPIWNCIKQEAITFIGTTLKELAIKGAVDASKWLIEQGEKTLLHLYKNASDEEKELFKGKVQEVFPDSPLLKKL